MLAQILADSPQRPHDADRFDWSSDVLDELARAVATLGRVVERFAGSVRSEASEDGDTDDVIDAKVQELTTAIVRQRNSLLAERAVSRRFHPGPGPVVPRR